MGRYYIRKRTVSKAVLQESQEKTKIVVTKEKLKIKSRVDKKSQVEDVPRLRSSRLLATTSKDFDVKKKINPVKETDKSDHKKNKKLKENNEEQVLKTVKNNSLSKDKQQPNDVKKKRIVKRTNKNMSSLRQRSIKESFLNQSKKLLRTHRNTPEKDTTDITAYLSPKSRRSFVLVKKLKEGKVPIYKRISPERSVHNESEIYDFHFDINDSKERLPKRTKRNVAAKKALQAKKKKIISKKQNIKKIVNKEAEAKNVPHAEDGVKSVVHEKSVSKLAKNNGESAKVESETTNMQYCNTVIPSTNAVRFTDIALKETEKKSTDKLLNTGNCMKPINEYQSPENAEINVPNNVELSKAPLSQSSLSENTSTESLAENLIKKSKVSIKSVQNCNNKRITIADNLQISKSDEFRPFRPTNIFNNKFLVQQRSVLNNSLFEKSLSPISKISENMEFNSPWRTPLMQTFSQVKNAFQSTPQDKMHKISNRKLCQTITNESKNYENVTKRKVTMLENNENMSQGYKNTNHSRKRIPIVPRKFGTVITNIDHSVQSNLGEEIIGQLSMEIENTQSNVQLSNRIDSIANNVSVLHSTENIMNNSSNSRIFKKNLKIETSQIPSPQRFNEDTKACIEKKNLDPQPGPSGVQNNRVLNDKIGVLRQTSLNNFLNIMDMPDSTSIKTPHGIFNDVSLTPINKSAKNPKISTSDLKTAFGFCDDDPGKDLSPVKLKTTNDENRKPFTRISIGEIKNQFLYKKPKKNIQPLINTENREVAEIEKALAKPKRNVSADIANFSDTFDMHDENCSTEETNTFQIPLFVDLEPSYFKEPPRYSYKRKRNVKFSFTDEETEDEKEKENAQVVSKKKRKKVDKESLVNKWVEDINKSFSEIDQFELVVE